jgi:transcriptional regulator with XRE-family HTH domain
MKRSSTSHGCRWRSNPPADGLKTPEFGVVLARLRHRARVPQTRFADLMGYDHSFVSRLEAGARMPSRAAVQRLATALALDAEDAGRLFAAAGFLHRAERAEADPLVLRLQTVLGDEAVPIVVRHRVREAVEVCVAYGELNGRP